MARRSVAAALAFVTFVVRAGSALAQEAPRPSPTPATSETEPAPRSSTYDPADEMPTPDGPGVGRVRPPAPAPREPGPPAEKAPESGGYVESVDVDGRVRLELGYDTNVFRSERGHTGDGFFHGFGEGNALVHFQGERELFANLTAEGFAYSQQNLTDEMYASTFLDYYHPLRKGLLDLDVQNTLEYSRQNLLDDNGDLLPREKYNAYDEEIHAALIVHLTDHLSWDVGGGYRYKNFEETHGLPSIDFQEVRGDSGLRFKIPWWPDGRLKLRFIFRDRFYYDFKAALRDGAASPTDPKLELQRHQVRASYSQKLDVLGMQLLLVGGYTFTYNEDLFENDRSYREHALSGRLEWWLVKDWTRLEVEVRGGTRSFLVRRTTLDQSLKQRYLDASALFWQQLFPHVGAVAEVGWYIYHSTEVRESYGRFIVQAGLEASF